ncbi:hypothetical protein Ptr902_12564 [Pyrenophora tritici-repentis]|nr:hypothetical protein Ptr902_12564 [Pyrenophora tritici-repentis]
MALVGVCFSIAFTFGPALGAYLSTLHIMDNNPHLSLHEPPRNATVSERIPEWLCQRTRKRHRSTETRARTNSHTLLNATHFTFILFFSGMEFSLPFMTYDLFSYQAKDSGRLLGFIGLVASLLQASVVRRQIGRSLGPSYFAPYTGGGSGTAYATGAAGMVAVAALVFGGLKVPPGTENVGKKEKKVA